MWKELYNFITEYHHHFDDKTFCDIIERYEKSIPNLRWWIKYVDFMEKKWIRLTLSRRYWNIKSLPPELSEDKK